MENFDLYLIKPTRYDDDGYPLQWWRSAIPSNSLAALYGIALNSETRNPLGHDVKINIHAMDEVNTDVNPSRIIKKLNASGRRALIALVGVQTNMFPRAIDLARQFVAHDIPVCIGGFHVSGCLSMLKKLPKDLVEAQEMGISFFAGEAEEGRFDEVIVDANNGKLKPIYNHINNMPNVAGAPIPFLPKEMNDRVINYMSSFDLGRGCPFECSFCTIINVQGRKSRFRTADDLEKIIIKNAKIGINRFFITDDNFARNKNWREFTDRLKKLRKDGYPVELSIQVDTLSHEIKGFVEECIAAGVGLIFVGLESINADSLESVNKRQNRIEDYREMFLAWKKYQVYITCGYIIGFPSDTKETILADMEILKKNLPIDGLYLNYLTPLPGSADHKVLFEAGEWMDPDMNKYDLNHRVTNHAVMSDTEWEDAYREAHASFYSWEHMETIYKRMAALKSNKKYITLQNLAALREAPRIEQSAALEAGYIRIRRRKQRRSQLLIENPLIFYPKYFLLCVRNMAIWACTFARLYFLMKRTYAASDRLSYVDDAIRDNISSEEDALISDTRLTDYAKKRIKKGLLSKS